MARNAFLIPTLLTGLVACSEASGAVTAADSAVPASASGATCSAPSATCEEDYSGLLKNLSGPAVKRLTEVRDGREAGLELPTSLPSEIDYAPDIQTAIERATAEDKPIFLTSVVNKGGRKKPGCEV